MLEYPEIDGSNLDGQVSQKNVLLVSRNTKSTNAGGRLFFLVSLFQLNWGAQNVISNATTLGWGFSFSGRTYFGAKKHWFRWMASYSQG